MAETDVDLIIALSQIIRKVDSNHSLGAAALAEAILSHHLVTDFRIAAHTTQENN